MSNRDMHMRRVLGDISCPADIAHNLAAPQGEPVLRMPWMKLSVSGLAASMSRERLAASEVVALAASGQRLVVPIIVRGQQLTALDRRLRFETPNDFVLASETPSAP
jgi:hypothetical protein